MSYNIVCKIKNFLTFKFDTGEVNVILSVRKLKKKYIMLLQEHYIKNILEKFEPFDIKVVSTPYNFDS